MEIEDGSEKLDMLLMVQRYNELKLQVNSIEKNKKSASPSLESHKNLHLLLDNSKNRETLIDYSAITFKKYEELMGKTPSADPLLTF